MSTNSDPVITVAQAKRLRFLITKRVTAALDRAWIGVQDPQDRAAILKADEQAAKKLDDYITKLRGGMTA